MNLKALMKEYLHEEGFKASDEEYGLSFRYRGRNIIFKNEEGDASFLQLLMPGICMIDETNRSQALEVCNKLTWGRKVVKLSVLDDSVWISFEILVDTTPEFDEFVPRALHMLCQARDSFYAEMEKAQQDEDAQ